MRAALDELTADLVESGELRVRQSEPTALLAPFYRVTPVALGACKITVSAHADSFNVLAGDHDVLVSFDDPNLDRRLEQTLLVLRAIREGRCEERHAASETAALEGGRWADDVLLLMLDPSLGSAPARRYDPWATGTGGRPPTL